jgi:hypothetical protein
VNVDQVAVPPTRVADEEILDVINAGLVAG